MGPGLTWCVLLITLSATLKVAYLQAPNAADGNDAADGVLSICGVGCIIGIVLAVIGVVILAAGITYRYWNINDKPQQVHAAGQLEAKKNNPMVPGNEERIVPRFSDYKPKGRLGKGGFGVVYHVLSEIDGGEYALKRIKVPDDRVAQEKVMREVQALEQLSHPGIVHYFNSWRETAPKGENGVEEWMSQTTSNSSPTDSRRSEGQSVAASSSLNDKVVSEGSSILCSLSRDDQVVSGGSSIADSSCVDVLVVFEDLSVSGSSSRDDQVVSGGSSIADSSCVDVLVVFEDLSVSGSSSRDDQVVSGGSSVANSSSVDNEVSSVTGSVDQVVSGGSSIADSSSVDNLVVLEGSSVTGSSSRDDQVVPGGSSIANSSSVDNESSSVTGSSSRDDQVVSGGSSIADSSSVDNLVVLEGSSVTGSSSRDDQVVSGGSSIANSSSVDSSVDVQVEGSSGNQSMTGESRSIDREPHVYLFIQMELCQKESLQDWLMSNVINRTHGEVFHLFDQISGAVMYLHSKDLMHRDLKPSNIFFTHEGRAVLGDFGLATRFTQDSLHNSCLTLVGEGEQRHRQRTANLGTNLYMSPELTSGTVYDQKVDVFSLGVIFFELYFPFHTGMERVKVLEDLRKYKFPPNFSSRLCIQADMVQWMMTFNPKDRPSVKDIRSSKQLKQLKENLQSNAMETIPKL